MMKEARATAASFAMKLPLRSNAVMCLFFRAAPVRRMIALEPNAPPASSIDRVSGEFSSSSATTASIVHAALTLSRL